MIFSDSSQASWRRATIRGCGFLFAAFVALWSVAASAQVFTLTLQPNTIPSGTENTPYSQLITAVGGNAPYTFAVTSGVAADRDTLAPGGLLSGTPTTPNSYSFTITATDNDGNTGFRPYTFSIGTPGGITINPGSPAGRHARRRLQPDADHEPAAAAAMCFPSAPARCRPACRYQPAA